MRVSGWPVAVLTVIVRPVPDRMPLVTVSVKVPSGLPMAMTVAPTGVAAVADDRRQAAGIGRQCEVRLVRLFDDGWELAAVGQLNGQDWLPDDVAVGQDVAVGRQDHARADPVDGICPKPREGIPGGDGDRGVANRGDDVGQLGSVGCRRRAATVTAAGAPGAGRGANGPATSAAVPPAAAPP